MLCIYSTPIATYSYSIVLISIYRIALTSFDMSNCNYINLNYNLSNVSSKSLTKVSINRTISKLHL